MKVFFFRARIKRMIHDRLCFEREQARTPRLRLCAGSGGTVEYPEYPGVVGDVMIGGRYELKLDILP